MLWYAYLFPLQHQNSSIEIFLIQRQGYPNKTIQPGVKKREFFPLPASKPGYFYRYAEDGIIDAGLLPVISTQEILALVLYRDGLFLGYRDVIELDEGRDPVINPGLLYRIP